MKLQFKALSVTLGLVALLGAGTSVRSSIAEISQADNVDTINLQDAEENYSDYNSELEVSEEIEDAELEATETIEKIEMEASEEVEDIEIEAFEEVEGAELGA